MGGLAVWLVLVLWSRGLGDGHVVSWSCWRVCASGKLCCGVSREGPGGTCAFHLRSVGPHPLRGAVRSSGSCLAFIPLLSSASVFLSQFPPLRLFFSPSISPSLVVLMWVPL